MLIIMKNSEFCVNSERVSPMEPLQVCGPFVWRFSVCSVWRFSVSSLWRFTVCHMCCLSRLREGLKKTANYPPFVDKGRVLESG